MYTRIWLVCAIFNDEWQLEKIQQWGNNGVGRVDKLQGPPECSGPEFQAKKFKKNNFLISQITHTLYCHLHKVYR